MQCAPESDNLARIVPNVTTLSQKWHLTINKVREGNNKSSFEIAKTFLILQIPKIIYDCAVQPIRELFIGWLVSRNANEREVRSMYLFIYGSTLHYITFLIIVLPGQRGYHNARWNDMVTKCKPTWLNFDQKSDTMTTTYTTQTLF